MGFFFSSSFPDWSLFDHIVQLRLFTNEHTTTTSGGLEGFADILLFREQEVAIDNGVWYSPACL